MNPRYPPDVPMTEDDDVGKNGRSNGGGDRLSPLTILFLGAAIGVGLGFAVANVSRPAAAEERRPLTRKE